MLLIQRYDVRMAESVPKCSASSFPLKRSDAAKQARPRSHLHATGAMRVSCSAHPLALSAAGFKPLAPMPPQSILLRPFLAIKAFRDRLLADDGFMNKAASC